MSMTENEAKDILIIIGWCRAEEGDVEECKALDMAINALEVVEECRIIVESYKAVQTLHKNGIIDKEEKAVHEHNLLFDIVEMMMTEVEE